MHMDRDGVICYSSLLSISLWLSLDSFNIYIYIHIYIIYVSNKVFLKSKKLQCTLQSHILPFLPFLARWPCHHQALTGPRPHMVEKTAKCVFLGKFVAGNSPPLLDIRQPVRNRKTINNWCYGNKMDLEIWIWSREIWLWPPTNCMWMPDKSWMAAIVAPNPRSNGFYDLSQMGDISPLWKRCRITGPWDFLTLKILCLRWNLVFIFKKIFHVYIQVCTLRIPMFQPLHSWLSSSFPKLSQNLCDETGPQVLFL